MNVQPTTRSWAAMRRLANEVWAEAHDCWHYVLPCYVPGYLPSQPPVVSSSGVDKLKSRRKRWMHWVRTVGQWTERMEQVTAGKVLGTGHVTACLDATLIALAAPPSATQKGDDMVMLMLYLHGMATLLQFLERHGVIPHRMYRDLLKSPVEEGARAYHAVVRATEKVLKEPKRRWRGKRRVGTTS